MVLKLENTLRMKGRFLVGSTRRKVFFNPSPVFKSYQLLRKDQQSDLVRAHFGNLKKRRFVPNQTKRISRKVHAFHDFSWLYVIL